MTTVELHLENTFAARTRRAVPALAGRRVPRAGTAGAERGPGPRTRPGPRDAANAGRSRPADRRGPARGRDPDRPGLRRPPVRRLLPPPRRRARAAARRGDRRQPAHRRDLHLKGSGRTPFSRGGDGKAAVGPMLREYVIGEAMHALGVPTTRALAVLGTGERIAREEGALPGAVLVRVAASHLRVGSFQYAAALTPGQEGPDGSEASGRLRDRPPPPGGGAGRAALPRPARSSDAASGRAGRALDVPRVRPRRDEHRQRDDLRRDHRLRAVRVHGGLRPGHGVQLHRPRRALRLRQPAPDHAVEPVPVRGGPPPPGRRRRERRGHRGRGRPARPGARHLPRPVRRRLARGHARQGRAASRHARRTPSCCRSCSP